MRSKRSSADVSRDNELQSKVCTHCNIRKPFQDLVEKKQKEWEIPRSSKVPKMVKLNCDWCIVYWSDFFSYWKDLDMEIQLLCPRCGE